MQTLIRKLLIMMALLTPLQVVHGLNYAERFEFGLQAGPVFVERDGDLGQGMVYGGRLSYFLTDHWKLEANGFGGVIDRHNVEGTNECVIADAELQYYFGRNKLRSFLALGGGSFTRNPKLGPSQVDFIAVDAAGLEWLIAKNTALRFDLRHFIDMEAGTSKNAFMPTLGISWFIEAPEPEKPVVRDSDGDGVMDEGDKCPDTPTGTRVDSSGCPRDSDGDGVLDAEDSCPNTARGVAVAANGCPADTDGDGVNNDMDLCSGTPSQMKVDDVGCPQVAKIPEAKAWVLQGVTFEINSDRIQPASLPVLDEAVNILQANPTVRIEIGGHTDTAGRPKVNQALSERRARSVGNYLIEKGVPADRIEVKGYGSTVPVADNSAADGRAQNRRIEFKVLSR